MSTQIHLIFATNNAHKFTEISAYFANSFLRISSLLDFPEIPEAPEPFHTFHENAQAKAEFVRDQLYRMDACLITEHTWIVSDDSGLEVQALQGAPGVHSKRYTLEATAIANNNKLLHELHNITDRSAQFRCVLAIAKQHAIEFVEGICIGTIAEKPTGNHGFGYDPIFIPQEYPTRSMADLSMEEKNSISHRGRALEKLRALIEKQSI